jgi:hypothetical protein
MMRRLIKYSALAALVGLGACEDALVVDNPNQGDTDKVISTPADAEALISTYYKRWYSGVYGSTGSMEGRLNVWSFLNFSSLANNCQNTSYPFGNSNVTNTPGNPCGGEHSRLYFILGEVDRVASSLLGQMDNGLTMGSVARDARARAFAEFLRGMSLGYLALMQDSAAIITAATPAQDPGALVGYVEVMDSAYAALQRSIDIANLATSSATDGFPLPTAWLPSGTSMTAAEFVKLMRSYRARFRANVVRTPAEANSIDWSLVIADAAAGITADHEVVTGTATGGTASYSWRQQYNDFSTWHQMTPFIIGMADNSGSYANWIGQPLGDRGAGNTGFFMTTPDLRFPQGATRNAQIADLDVATCEAAATKCKRYFRNRPAGSDQFGGVGWGWSNYDFVRYRSWHVRGDAGTARVGKTPIMLLAEMDLLRAEGLMKQAAPDYAGAIALINKTRTAGMAGNPSVATGGGLPALTSLDPNAGVPGGADCVPKVPQGPAFTTIACGNMFEALKWEKRVETGYTHYLSWYLDGRRWGDLAEGTPLFLPVPYQDWQARDKPSNLIYHTGVGVGVAPNSAAVGKGNYGW